MSTEKVSGPRLKRGNFVRLESLLGHGFASIDILEQALTHSSHANEADSEPESQAVADNEQLEFLGDAVLGFVTSQALFERYPQYSEGQLSKTRAHLVSARHLLKIANEIHLGDFLLLGRGEERSGGRQKSALLVDALEAVVAALYIDGGMEAARNFILMRIVNPELERTEHDPLKAFEMSDQKSALQEWLQSVNGPMPVYTVVREEGPDHNKTFVVELRLKEVTTKRPKDGNTRGFNVLLNYAGRAQGPTKKTAEQKAAQEALAELKNQDLSIRE